MKKISVIGVLVGGGTDIVSTSIFQTLLTIYVLTRPEIRHAPRDQIRELVAMTVKASPVLAALHFLIGHGCSVLGGFVSAMVAKHDELLNGALASFLCFSIGLYLMASGKSREPLSQQIVHQCVCPLLALLGGYLYLKVGKTSAPVPKRFEGEKLDTQANNQIT
jgi:hypothetical protein